jgi:hypothetical protein
MKDILDEIPEEEVSKIKFRSAFNNTQKLLKGKKKPLLLEKHLSDKE